METISLHLQVRQSAPRLCEIKNLTRLPLIIRIILQQNLCGLSNVTTISAVSTAMTFKLVETLHVLRSFIAIAMRHA
jgi:hypothetical protein